MVKFKMAYGYVNIRIVREIAEYIILVYICLATVSASDYY